MPPLLQEKKYPHVSTVSLIPQGPWGGRWAPASVWGHPGAGQDHASAVAQDSGPGPQQQGRSEIRQLSSRQTDRRLWWDLHSHS